MGILKISCNLIQQDKRVLTVAREFFDQMEPFDIIEGEDPLYRVSKADLGIVYNDDSPVTVTFREIPTSIIFTGISIPELKITDVNGVGLEPKNYGCPNPDTLSLKHIKSKG